MALRPTDVISRRLSTVVVCSVFGSCSPPQGEGRLSVIAALEAPRPPSPQFIVDKNPEHCGATLSDPVLVGDNEGVANVLLVAPAAHLIGSKPPVERFISVSECQFIPRLQVAQCGDVLVITMSDTITHNPHAWVGDRTLFNVTLPGDRSTAFRRTLRSPGLIRIECDTHRWMRAYIYVCHQGEVAAVTDSNGAAKLELVSAGKCGLKWWHELFDWNETTARVESNAECLLQIMLKPSDAVYCNKSVTLTIPWPSPPASYLNER